MRRRQNQLALLVILAVTTFSVVVTWPGDPDRYLPDFVPWPSGSGLTVGDFDRADFRLGLDLAGGVSVTLEASGSAASVRDGESLNGFAARHDVALDVLLDLNRGLEALDADEYDRPLPADLRTLTLPLDPDLDLSDDLEQARLIIEERVNGFGVSEAEVTLIGDDRINAQIPGVTAAEAAGLVGSTALLEFREVDPEQPAPAGPVDPTAARITVIDAFDPLFQQEGFPDEPRLSDTPISDPDEDVVLAPLPGGGGDARWIPAIGLLNGEEVPLDGTYLVADSIARTFDTGGQVALAFGFDDDGAELFEQITSRLVTSQSPLGIFVDGQLISAPNVTAVISDSGIITGISDEQSRTLRRQLRAGALPINFRTIQQTEVAATLGEDSVVDTVQAGLIAFLAIIIFMVVYYRLPGLLAALALFVYVSMVMATFKLLPVTLTLAGIAGFVLSVGLAVDGNILIFERMKEELRLGRSLQGAVEAGWNRAWPAIRDGNVSTLITVVILWFFADQLNANLIKSFAIALLVGTIFSMVTAIFVTRTFLQSLIGFRLTRKPWLFGIRETPLLDDDRPGRRRSAGTGGD
ncbi:MAG: preprotein translocase subunit SecD [Chloroflexi bacterium]|nr:MAG: preprotein translocase subunit SecD [Chloroflexota bacterium]